MTESKDQVIQQIEQKSRKKLGELSLKFARAKSEKKEEILAEMEFERELADMCDICLD